MMYWAAMILGFYPISWVQRGLNIKEKSWPKFCLFCIPTRYRLSPGLCARQHPGVAWLPGRPDVADPVGDRFHPG